MADCCIFAGQGAQVPGMGKDFAEADRLRDEVIAKGYLIEDTAQGPKIKKA